MFHSDFCCLKKYFCFRNISPQKMFGPNTHFLNDGRTWCIELFSPIPHLSKKRKLTSCAALLLNSLFIWSREVLSEFSIFGWWMTMLGIMGDHPLEGGQQYLGRWFWIMGDQPKADRWPSRRYWVTILVLKMVGDHLGDGSWPSMAVVTWS